MSQLPDQAAAPQDPARAPAAAGGEGAATAGIAADVAAALSGLSDLPVDQHPEVYDDIHRRLGDTLSGTDHV